MGGIGKPVGELVQKTGLDTSYLGVYLKRLIGEGKVLKIGYGIYSLTEEGIKRAKFLQQQAEMKQSSLPVTLPVRKLEIDLENTDTILQLKEAYGKEKFLQVLDKIRKIIE